MAPDATLFAYRIFSCISGSGPQLFIAAMERAYKDGADIITFGLGSAFPSPDHGAGADLAFVAANLQKLGVITVAGVGDGGGMFQLVQPHAAMLSVTSASGPSAYVEFAAVNPGNVKVPYVPATEPDFSTLQVKRLPRNSPLPLALSAKWTLKNGNIDPATIPAADACTAADVSAAVAGKVAIVRRGSCGTASQAVTKAANLKAAGALGLIFIDNEKGPYLPFALDPDTADFPFINTDQATGLALVKKVLLGATTITFNNNGLVRAPSPGSAGRLPDFVATGPAANLALKPDIAAPGAFGTVITTQLLSSGGGYGYFAGSAAATPFVAGCVALLKQANPRITLAEVTQFLQNTALPQKEALSLLPANNPAFTNQLAPVNKQGGGLIDIYSAITSKQRVSPTNLVLGSVTRAVAKKITITNTDSKGVRFTLGHEATLAQPYPEETLTIAPAAVRFSSASISVKAKSTASFVVIITPPAKLRNQSLFGGYIVLKGTRTFRVPYTAVKGDYQKFNPILSVDIGTSGPTNSNFTVTNQQQVDAAIPATGSWVNTTFDMYTKFPTLQFSPRIASTRLVATVTQISTGLKLTFRDEPYPYVGVTFQVPYNYANAAFIPAERPTGLNNDNFRCVLQPGLYQVTLTLTRPLGGPKTAIVVGGPKLRFRLARPTLGTAGVFCQKARG